MDAARTPGWSMGVGRRGEILATKDSGEIGRPWAVTATRVGRSWRVSRYEPGDDVEAEGVVVGEVSGNPREAGRQLRDLLSGLEFSN